MRKTSIVPSNTERNFRINESFFSCTDTKGTILAGNAVFQRVSGYSESELVGSPHNVIRHPDMPRAVFKLFWDTILGGQPIAAVVKNMAKDGAYYWVVALVAPTKSGFVSIRFKPGSALFGDIVSIYSAMRKIEVEIEGRGESPKAAMEASTAHLLGSLEKLGFPSYEAFMRALLLRSEIDARDEALRKEGLFLIPELPDVPDSTGPTGLLRECILVGRRELEGIRELYVEMSELVDLDRELLEKSGEAMSLAEDFSLMTMNIEIQAWRCGDTGRGIPVVAGHLSESSAAISQAVTRVRKKAEETSTLIGHTLFGVAWARLQMEMAVKHYIEVREELISGTLKPGTKEFDTRVLLVDGLAESANHTHIKTIETLKRMETALNDMGEESDTMRRFMVSLMVSKVVGLTEAARLVGVDSLNAAFADMKGRVDKIQESFGHLETLIDKLLVHAKAAPKLSALLRRSTERLEKNAGALKAFNVPADSGAPPKGTESSSQKPEGEPAPEEEEAALASA